MNASPPSGERAAAPAKINLGLRIVGRRDDGYHLLESVFLPLDLADEVDLACQDADAVSVSLEVIGSGAPEVPAGSDNLAVRAAAAFADAAGRALRVRIRLAKHIPAAAGLGGGSSDAAAVLRILARRFPGAVSPAALRALALGLGADVPYFLDPRPALVTGIGETVEPIPGLPPLALLLANPGVALSTAEVFRARDVLGVPTGAGAAAPPASVDPEVLGRLAEGNAPGLLRNDLRPAAVRLCPVIARLEAALGKAGARAVGMSGSGPTVYGVFPSREEARQGLARAALAPPVWARVAVTADSG